MEKSKFQQIIILLLLLINTGTLTFMWINRPPHPHFPPGRAGSGAFDFIVHETKMNGEQQEKYSALRDEHRDEIKKTQEKIHLLKKEIYDHFPDEKTMRANAHKIGNLQIKTEEVTYQHFLSVRALLEPDQQEIFDRIIPEATAMMAPR